ncbi:MAG TPA: transposase [bacterium]|nr:transposase [bacterium]
MDETYIDPDRKRAVPVFGMTQRKRAGKAGRVRVVAIPDGAKTMSVMPHVREQVLPNTMIYTDESPIFQRGHAYGRGHTHRRIYHSLKVYVQGNIYTSTVNGFWAWSRTGLAEFTRRLDQTLAELLGRVRLPLQHPEAARGHL